MTETWQGTKSIGALSLLGWARQPEWCLGSAFKDTKMQNFLREKRVSSFKNGVSEIKMLPSIVPQRKWEFACIRVLAKSSIFQGSRSVP